ncbi:MULTISPECIES: DsbA family protein [Methylobacterium]|jgi:protein-disulfide isomerase|uniref:DsbA family protein n=2 Tax=Methylobacteriaceae TaxID=119045 RepID=UPI0008F121A3|nr:MULTISPECIES: DsbA family protein [Methylobacterium]MBK3398745.1 DsbA family protein [Methylobacterium ajmalii]MBK3409475.1 DsbA family protein [Methylobacterium ajmalii]MBZ6414402.1 DsbA family protein [Methylobacterium sp.]SFE13280.1 DSBA-like thioredoxin domain-containing protein [Methylobacterium sp. yr596]
MPLSRRTLIAASLAALPALAPEARAQAEGQWRAITGDNGQPLPNTRLPGELVSEIGRLRGVTWIGPREASVTLFEFFDYNCPWCRAAARDLDDLVRANPDLRIGLINNPILSVQSAQAAKVALAVQRAGGSAATAGLYAALLGPGTAGRIDGTRALEAAARLGHDRAAIEQAADSDEVREALKSQMRLAANLGLHATPSYVVGTAALLGYPGPKSLARVLAAVAECDEIACAS